MEIGNTFAVHGPQKLAGPHRAAASTATRETVSVPFAGRDEITLSPAAKLSQASEANEKGSSGPIRFDLVNRIRSEIAAGTYDTHDKMSAAFDRMLASAMR